jgi:hypothetical protein
MVSDVMTRRYRANRDLEALVDGDVAVTATYTLTSVRYLAAGTTRLSEA